MKKEGLWKTKVTAYAVSNLPMQEQLWIVDDSVTAVSLNFYCDFAFDVGAEAVLDFKALWDRYVDDLNAKATKSFHIIFHIYSFVFIFSSNFKSKM